MARTKVLNPQAVFACACAFALGAAGDTQVANEVSVSVGNGDAVSVATAASVAYPSDVANPAFWFDASRTNDWTIAANGEVSRIPSLVGSRFLSSDMSAGGWPGVKAANPVWKADSRLAPGGALDFGAMASKKALAFNAVEIGGAATNLLADIGTIVAVWNSENSGGWLLGGGGTSGYAFHRAVNYTEASSGAWTWTNPVFNNGNADKTASNGTFREDGAAISPYYVGYGNCWQVISLQPTAAKLTANGVGIGDWRNTGRSGGMGIAEMLIFDRVLSDADLAKVETWLERKWLGRDRRGFNGNAAAGRFVEVVGDPYGSDSRTFGLSAEVDVPAGETLALDRVEAGAGGGTKKLVKKGAGALRVANAENWSGAVELKDGTLDFPAEKVPTADELPHDLYARFDASDLATLDFAEEGGRRYVKRWRNLANGKTAGKAFCAAAESDARRPWLLENALGAGLHALDFSAETDASGDGRSLRFSTQLTDDGAGEYKGIPGICTFVAVIGAQRGGGVLLGGASLERKTRGTGLHTAGISDDPNATVFVDGCLRAPTNGLPHAGWQTLAVRTRGGDVARIAQYDTSVGGAKYAEILIWNRVLTDDELKRASAYLSAKWLKKRIPGFAGERALERAADLQHVKVSGAATLNVEDGVTVRVGKLSLAADLVKTGGGTLEVQAADSASAGKIVVRGGKVISARPADVDAKCAVAADPSLHLDASDSASLTVDEVGGVEKVKTWLDKKNRNAAFATDSCCPTVDRTDTLNGLPLVDFGTPGTGAGHMTLARTVHGALSIFAVWDGRKGGGFAFGSSSLNGDSNNGFYDFHPHMTGNVSDRLFIEYGNQKHLMYGVILTNGVSASCHMKLPTAEPLLMEYHPDGGAHVSGLCRDRGNTGSRSGGSRFGEVIIYERQLTDREKVATRNYLLKKWFGKAEAELPDLPGEAAVPPTLAVRSYEVDGTQTVSTAVADVSAATLTGAGTFEKTGAGTLTVDDLSSFGGTVRVEAGTLKARLPAASSGALVESGRILHLDANVGVETETNSAGVVQVRRWNSVLGDGWSAEAHGKNGSLPTLMQTANGTDPGFSGAACSLPAVDMLGGATYCNHFTFATNGVDVQLGGIRSVFWVVGSQNGGGFLLGGGTVGTTARAYAWHRGTPNGTGSGSGAEAADALIGSSAVPPAQNADWRKNGERVKAFGSGAACLSGGWDLLSVNVYDKYSAPTADGLAFDGRNNTEGATDWHFRDGRQRLGELIIYDRRLTADEIAANEAYLAAKWGFSQRAASCPASLVLASGASFDCGGGLQRFASLSGTGSVVDGEISAAKILYDFAVGGFVSAAVFAVPANLEIELANLPARSALRGRSFVVLHADEFADSENLSAVRLVGDEIPSGLAATLRPNADGDLKLRFYSTGSAVIVR